jgi:hypothetical protein
MVKAAAGLNTLITSALDIFLGILSTSCFFFRATLSFEHIFPNPSLGWQGSSDYVWMPILPPY